MHQGLHIEGLAKTIKSRPVLSGIDLHLRPGSFYMLLGENGAGKTTLFRCLLGLTKYSGAVRVVGAEGTTAVPRADFAPVLDRTTLHAGWAVTANINYQLNNSRGHRLATIEGILSPDLLRATAGKLSTGQRKIVMMAIALASDAPVLLLDEFANGLDFANRREMRTSLEQAGRQGRIILATGHDLDAFEGLPSHVGKLDDGKLTDLTAAYHEAGHLKQIYELPPQ